MAPVVSAATGTKKYDWVSAEYLLIIIIIIIIIDWQAQVCTKQE